ncbi:MFS general substrate transporter [Xylariaceae sp. FL0804]|nr:MFS general substrate transporter [Xylariaceae sp. FL0804]
MSYELEILPAPSRERSQAAESDRIRASEGTIRSIPASLTAPYDVPDGGVTAWLQVLVGHIAFMVSWGYSAAFAVFQPYYEAHLVGASPSQVAWIGSLQMALYFLLGVASGRLADAGHTRTLVMTGSVLVVAAMLLTSFARAYWQVLACQGILNGLGGGLMSLPSATNIVSYFARNRTLAMATNAAGASTGAILYAVVVQQLTPRAGFAWAVRVCALVTAALCAVACALLRPRLFVDRESRRPLLDLAAFRDFPFLALGAGGFLVWASSYSLTVYVAQFAQESVGLSEKRAVNLVYVVQAAGILARPFAGWIADKYVGPLNSWSLNAFLLAVVAFGWIGVRSRAGAYGYAAAMGFMQGAAQGVFPGATSSIVSDPSRMGTWVGMSYALVGLGALAGPPVTGAIIDVSGGRFLNAQIFAGVVGVVGSAGILLAARAVSNRRHGERWSVV